MPATIELTVTDPPDPPAKYRPSRIEVYGGPNRYLGEYGPSGMSGGLAELMRVGTRQGKLYAVAEWGGTDGEFERDDGPLGYEIESVYDPETRKWGDWQTL